MIACNGQGLDSMDELFRPVYDQLMTSSDIYTHLYARTSQKSPSPAPPAPSPDPQSEVFLQSDPSPVHQTREDPPLEEEPLYVNAKQYFRILKRRVARARLEELHRLSRQRKVGLSQQIHHSYL